MTTFSDIFKKSFLQETGNLTTADFAMSMLAAFLCGMIIYMVYRYFYKGVIYNNNFNILLVMTSMITCFMVIVISSNVVLSLGMVGALSIVRFRTAIKDSRDTVYIFWAIIVGICCGVGDFLVASIGSGVVFVVILILGCIKNDNRMLLIIRAARSSDTMIKSLVYKLFDSKAILRVENTTENTVELIFELTQKMVKKAEKTEPSIADAVYKIGNIEYVNIVMQNDEISN